MTRRFLDIVRNARRIAFQKPGFGYAVASPLVAFYAPLTHPGGGNLSDEFAQRLKDACLKRISDPHARTLRPTAKPIPTASLVAYLRSAFGESVEAMSNYDKAAGDHFTVVESECQIVILAIEEDERPDLRDATWTMKRDEMSDALDIVIQNAESARELCEVGEDKPRLIKMYLLQSSMAMKSALEMLLKP